MPKNPFTDYNSNERDVAIPIVPTKCTVGAITAASTVVIDLITLSAANLAAGTVNAYIYYIYLWARQTAAASDIDVVYQWQFRTAAHANVGAAVITLELTAGVSGALAGGVINNATFAPNWPFHSLLTIPATAAEIVFQRATVVGGAPAVASAEGWGIDLINTGTPGDIGSGGMVAQSATNPNTF